MNFEPIYLALRKRLLLITRGRYFVAERRGIRYLLDAYSYIDRRIEAYGVYEDRQLRYFIESLKVFAPSLFIDAGANSGLYTLNLGVNFPGIKTAAFEPDLRNRAQLTANLFLNDLHDSVEIHPIALSNCSGTAHFHRHDRENPGRSMIAASGELEVELKALDEVINLTGKKIALKIDVEGHELPLLQGSEQLLTQNDCFIQVESFAPDKVISYLQSLGYVKIHNVGNDFYFSRENAV